MRQAAIASSPKLTQAQLDGVDDFLRLKITAQTVFALARQLTPGSWAGLHSYIMGDFKKSQDARSNP